MKKGNKKQCAHPQEQDQQQQQNKKESSLPIKSIPPSSKKLSQTLIPIFKALLSIFSFYIVCIYFGVFTFIQSPEANNSGYLTKSLWCFSFSVILYIINYITYIVRPRPSQRITIERWYTVTPITVWSIMIGHALGLAFMIAMLWPQYGALSILFCGIFAFMMLYILQFSPI